MKHISGYHTNLHTVEFKLVSRFGFHYLQTASWGCAFITLQTGSWVLVWVSLTADRFLVFWLHDSSWSGFHYLQTGSWVWVSLTADRFLDCRLHYISWVWGFNTCRQVCGHAHRVKVERRGSTILHTPSEVPNRVCPRTTTTDVVHAHSYADVVLHNSVCHAHTAHRLQQHVARGRVVGNVAVGDQDVGILSQCAQSMDSCSIAMVLVITQG